MPLLVKALASCSMAQRTGGSFTSVSSGSGTMLTPRSFASAELGSQPLAVAPATTVVFLRNVRRDSTGNGAASGVIVAPTQNLPAPKGKP